VCFERFNVCNVEDTQQANKKLNIHDGLGHRETELMPNLQVFLGCYWNFAQGKLATIGCI